jgi:site-specific recombinase XerD
MTSSVAAGAPIPAPMADVQTRAGFRREQIRRGLSSRTITERDRALDLLSRRLEDVPLVAATRDDIDDFLDSRPISKRTRAVYLSHLHAFYAWALDEGHADADPTARIIRPRLPRMIPRPIPDDDLLHALRTAPPRMRAWLSLGAYEGLRCKEIAGVRREDVLDRHSPPLLRIWKGKGDHQAVLPLNPETLAALRLYGLPARGYVFTGPGGGPMKAKTVSAVGNRYLHSIGITATMHQLRHWFGTAVWAETKDMRVTQEMMRHASPATTAGYAAFDWEIATTAVVRIHRRLGPEHLSLVAMLLAFVALWT